MLHRLGVNMGAPFWRNSEEHSPENYYEPYDLSSYLRRCWTEPSFTERVSSDHRSTFLRDWIMFQESKGERPTGAKHPLLGLCVQDLLAAWGGEVCLIWSWRPLEQSIAGLARRSWFPSDVVEPLQTRLWDTLQELEQRRSMHQFNWDQVKENPADAARNLALLAGVFPTDQQFAAAAEFVRTGGAGTNPTQAVLVSEVPLAPHLLKRTLHTPRKPLSVHQG